MKYILFSSFLFLFSFAHPFYLGVTEFKYDAKHKSMQCAVKLFTNDLESTLRKLYKQPIDLINIKDTASVKKTLNTYILTRLKLNVNGTNRSYNFIGFEREEEATWIYLEFNNCEVPKKVEVQNTLLFDYLSQQTNIVHVEVVGNKKSSKASNPDKDFVFEF